MKSNGRRKVIFFFMVVVFQHAALAASSGIQKSTNENFTTSKKNLYEQSDDVKEKCQICDQGKNPFAQECGPQSIADCNSDVQCPDNKRFYDTKNKKCLSKSDVSTAKD